MNAGDPVGRRKPGRDSRYYLLLRQLPGLVDRVLQAHDISGAYSVRQLKGETNAVVEVASSKGKLIIKLSPYDDLAAEPYFYETLRRYGLPVPEVVAADFTRRTIPFMYEIFEHLDGADVDHLTLSQHERAGSIIGGAMRRMHRIEMPGFGHPMPDASWSHANFADALMDEYFNEAEVGVAVQVFDPNEIDQVGQILARADFSVSQARLIHCDAGRGNFLFTVGTEPELKAIIDPGGIIGGDPLWDLAIATNDFDSFGKGVREGYVSEGPDLAVSESRSLRIYHLLSLYWSTCWHVRAKQDHSVPLLRFRHVMAEMR